MTLADRILQRVTYTDTCWLWEGSLGSHGYGQIVCHAVDPRPMLVHRLIWEASFGPIPDGMYVCHTCDVKSCVRPSHLFLGTAADNHHDMEQKGRMVLPPRLYGEKHPASKLTEDQVATIRAAYAAGGVRQRDIAGRFGVSQVTVSMIVRGATWTQQ